VLDKRIRMLDPKRHVEQDFAGRDAARPGSRSVDVETHLLVARTTKSLLLGTFSDLSADVGNTVRPSREAVDLIEEPRRDPRREEPHALYRARQIFTLQSRLRAETVPK
jgi:hypothetical protein